MVGMLRKPAIVIPGLISLLMVLVALFAPVLAPFDPLTGSLEARLLPPAWEANGDMAHLLGTDRLGRDVLSRLIHGAKISLSVVALALLIAGSIGSALGIVAGYVGGLTEALLMRLVDLALSLPIILIALLFGVVFGPDFGNIVIIISLVLWSQFARMARSETLKIKNSEFVDLARTAGLHPITIMVRHIVPNVAGPLIVLATLQVGTVIIIEASLSFLGVGVPPPTPAWGSMIAEGRSYIVSEPWLCVIPGLAILVTVLAMNMLGDALAETLNPELAQRPGAG